MSTVVENRTLACPQTAPDACPPPLAPVAPSFAEEESPRPLDAEAEDVAEAVGAEAAVGLPGRIPSECGHNPG
jgi:hypothetical protein